MLYYNMKPGYVFPLRNYRIIQLTNKVHIFVWHYWPDYNQWLFNYIINRDQIYLVCDELDCRRLNFMCKVFKGVKLEYLKFANCRVTGQQLS